MNRQKQQHLRIDRKHLRVRTDLPCKVGPSNSKVTAARVLDLSIGGLKFSCNQATIQRIMPNEQQPLGMILGVEMVVHFNIKLENKRAVAIKTPARVIHTERLAQDLFHIGIQFLGLDTGTISNLETYIGELMTATDSSSG